MTIGEKIRERRIELGMTQEELAHKLGYKSRSSVNKVELANDLTLKTIKMYAKALRMDIVDLMGFKEPTEDDAHYLASLAKDAVMLEYVKRIMKMDNSKKNTLFNYIDFLSSEK